MAASGVRSPLLPDEPGQQVDKGAVYPGMGLALRGIGGVGDQVGEGILQNGGDVLLVGHEVDHGDLPLLPHQQVAAAGQRVLAGQLRDLLQAHALIEVILRAVETGEIDAVPARQFGDVVKAIAAFDAPGQQLPLVRVPQAADNGLHAPGQKLRRQDCSSWVDPAVGIHAAGQVQPLLPGPVQQGQHLGDLTVPAVPAHGLQVGDMHRGLQGPGHLHHLPGGLHHAAALLAHVHGDGDALPRQRGQARISSPVV